ncbi:hypothetical protein SHKM778_67650 [Streptomyces sp. KM77-8]|uniref:Inhibitor I9 domain-containing protein n=1 Tax=Streptomyces haneummycinicus TaxID=3074435 RepID=A0AAT9HSC7_9ACTN
MAHLRSRRRLALAVPVVLSLTASLGFLPAAASAAPRTVAAGQATDAPALAYVVNTKTDRRTIASVERTIAAAGGEVVVTYDRIGVIVVHSSNADFAKTVRKMRGVQSAGATRTAPLTAAGTTDEGAADFVTAAEAARTKAVSARTPGSEPSRPTSGTCGRSAPTRPRRSTTAAGR